MSNLKKGLEVNFKTVRGRTGTGKIVQVRDTAKGKWVDIKDSDGNAVSCRPVNVSAA